MSKGTLYDKVFENHTVGKLESGQTQLFVGRHLMHEVTSPQAFEMLRKKGLKVRRPDLTWSVIDHVIPTDNRTRPFKDPKDELMAKTLIQNAKETGIHYFEIGSGKQGVCHVTYPEQGILLPGVFAVCGDSHTATYGAVGAIAMGIGTTEVSYVLATQTLKQDKLKVKRVEFEGELGEGVGAKDAVMAMIKQSGFKSGIGFAYELGGSVIDNLDMEGRLTICNMGVEANARSCYINPDQITFEYLKGKPFAPKENFDKAVEYWKSIASDKNAEYDEKIIIKAPQTPMVTWGVNPEQAASIEDKIPYLSDFEGKQKENAEDALEYMGLKEGNSILGTPIDVAFIGSCTNGRLSDLKVAAEILNGKKVSTRTVIVPGSEQVSYQAEQRGYDKTFKKAGAEWREPGCSMCLSMSPDRLLGQVRSISTSNRNFKNRQGKEGARTHLADPRTVAASAIEGVIADHRLYSR